jgi:peptidoglycan L-alanyl-D-glutamate endopeptidase CwlK
MRSPLLDRDRLRLAGAHPDLVRVVERARLTIPFIVVEGLRSRERQERLVAIGASRTLNSRHLTGHAVDLAYWLDDGDGAPEAGEVRWDWPLARKIATANFQVGVATLAALAADTIVRVMLARVPPVGT